MTAHLVPYEDHIPEGDMTEPECFVCGHEWPCGTTIAYNDGLNDGAVNERARIVAALRMWAVGSPEVLRAVGLIERGEL